MSGLNTSMWNPQKGWPQTVAMGSAGFHEELVLRVIVCVTQFYSID